MNTPSASPDLSCTFEQAEHNQLLAGIRMSTAAKIAWFEEMVAFAHAAGAMRVETTGAADAEGASELPPRD